MRPIIANRSRSLRQTLQGAPWGTYSLPSGPKAMNFQPCCLSVGNVSITTAGLGGSFRWASIASKRKIFDTADTYSAPSRHATPAGDSRPEAITWCAGYMAVLQFERIDVPVETTYIKNALRRKRHRACTGNGVRQYLDMEAWRQFDAFERQRGNRRQGLAGEQRGRRAAQSPASRDARETGKPHEDEKKNGQKRSRRQEFHRLSVR